MSIWKLFVLIITVLCINTHIVYSQVTLPENHEIKSYSEKKVSLKCSEGKKGTVIFFVSSQCPCSKGMNTYLVKIYEDFKNDFDFVAIHADQEDFNEESFKFFNSLNLPYPVVKDLGQVVAKALKAKSSIHTFILSPKMEVLFNGSPGETIDPKKIKNPYLENALTDVLAGREVGVKTSRPLGCPIDFELKAEALSGVFKKEDQLKFEVVWGDKPGISPKESKFSVFFYDELQKDGRAIRRPRDPKNTFFAYAWMKMHKNEKDEDHGTRPFVIKRVKEGHYEASKVYFTMEGEWDLHLQIKDLEKEEKVLEDLVLKVKVKK